jgi:hypothetical protein
MRLIFTTLFTLLLGVGIAAAVAALVGLVLPLMEVAGVCRDLCLVVMDWLAICASARPWRSLTAAECATGLGDAYAVAISGRASRFAGTRTWNGMRARITRW